jgi:hypothetical protein
MNGRQRRWWRWLLTSLLALVAATGLATATAATTTATLKQPAAIASASSSGQAATCVMGVYVDELRDFKFAEKSLYANLHVWSVCPTNTYEPLSKLVVQDNDSLTFEPVETRLEPNNSTYFSGLPQLYWSETSISGTFYYPWSAQNFPFDRHRITFQLETRVGTTEEFVITPDFSNSGFNPKLSNEDWIVGDFLIREGGATYASNFGNPSQGKDGSQSYSSISVQLQIHRARIASFFKLCAGVYAAVVISAVAFFMDPREPDLASGRTGLCVGCLFAAIVNMQQSESTLGLSETVTLTDSIHILSIIYILISTVLAIWSYLNCEAGHADQSRQQDRRIYFPVFLCSFLAFNGVIISYAALMG